MEIKFVFSGGPPALLGFPVFCLVLHGFPLFFVVFLCLSLVFQMGFFGRGTNPGGPKEPGLGAALSKKPMTLEHSQAEPNW